MRALLVAPIGVAVGVLAAGAFGVTAVALGVSPIPAVVGALVATAFEVRASAISRRHVAVVAAPNGPPSAARLAELRRNEASPSPAPVPSFAPPATPTSADAAPPALPHGPEPADEVPCAACGLYPGAGPAPVALPHPGTHRQVGPA